MRGYSGDPYEPFPLTDAELDDALRGVPMADDAPTPTPTDQTKERGQ